VFTVGGAGDPPAPPGDPPGAMAAAMSGCEKTVPFRYIPLLVPSGGSPDGTGESPVLPTLNTYFDASKFFELRKQKHFPSLLH
jgi:hypothetical protein